MQENPTLGPALGPALGKDRFDVVDVIRGVALLGILAANMRGFNAPDLAYGRITALFPDLASSAVQWFIDHFVQQRFITIFSTLFGLGFAIQMFRAGQKGVTDRFYKRRLFVLLLIGVFHATAIWWGDILFNYAIAGFILLLFKNTKTARLGRVVSIILGAPVVILTGVYLVKALGLIPKAKLDFGASRDPETIAELHAAVARHQFMQPLAHWGQNWTDWVTMNFQPTSFFAVYLFVLPWMLLGLWIWRQGFLQEPEKNLGRVRFYWGWALFIGVFSSAWGILCRWFLWIDTKNFDFNTYFYFLTSYCAVPALMVFYMSSLYLLFHRHGWRARLMPFAAVGRMALTNYLTQSFLLTNLFWLSGLYGKVGPVWDLLLTPLVYFAQLLFSNWWLARYQFGPAEWVWRSLTYGQAQPLRRKALASP